MVAANNNKRKKGKRKVSKSRAQIPKRTRSISGEATVRVVKETLGSMGLGRTNDGGKEKKVEKKEQALAGGMGGWRPPKSDAESHRDHLGRLE